MPRTSSRQLIGAPVDRVFNLATLPERLPEWNHLFVVVTGVSGPLTDAGAHVDAEMRIAGRRLQTLQTVSHVVRGRSIALVGTGRDGGRFTWTRRFEIVGTFGSVLETDFDYDLPRPEFGEPDGYRRGIENEVMLSVERLATLLKAQAVAV
jgi:hypothetical protein